MKISSPLVSPPEQGADFVELFFDLVFVFAITQVTRITAHHLDFLHVLKSVLIFWLIWWGWTQFTWALNAANTRHPQVRMITLAATGVAFVMAASAGRAFGNGALWFALPYIVVRTLGLAVYLRVAFLDEEQRAAVGSFAVFSLTGIAAVLVGAFASPSQRVGWWLAAIILDMVAGYIGGKKDAWALRASHFAERHGLIVIIALGESLIVAAIAVSSAERTTALAITAGLAVLVTCLLWWSYFSWIREYLEKALEGVSGSRQAQMGRDAYSIIHFPLVCGIIGIAIGFENILAHPEYLITMPVAMSLGGGVVLFVGSTAVSVLRAGRMLLVPRVIILVSIVLCSYWGNGKRPEIILGLLTMNLLVLLIIEWNICRRQFQSLHV